MDTTDAKSNIMEKQVLIVDDSSSIRQAMRYMLEKSGYTVKEASNGKDALAILEPSTKLIITDINMPGMSGIELVQTVRTGSPATKTVPIIILTTESMVEMKQKGKDAGATAWIVKPFTPEVIISTINKILG